MASVNKVTLLGNCGKDPEVRYMANGKAVTNISLATSSKRKSGEEWVEDTQWHRVTFYDKLAEIAGEYLKKGNPVYIEGSIKYGKFTNKDGHEQHTTDIVANSMQLLGGRTESAKPQQTAKKPVEAGSGFDNMDDDIPW